MSQELTLRIVLENPPAGIDFGVQKGRGTNYETVQKKRSGTQNLIFEFPVKIKAGNSKSGLPDFTGEFVQGPLIERFVYFNIGTSAGQPGSIWNRRLKIPLRGITTDMITEVLTDSNLVLETHVPGKGKDGGPNCATVKPFAGWHINPVKSND